MNIMISTYKIIAIMLIVYIKNIKGCQSIVNNRMEAFARINRLLETENVNDNELEKKL